MGLWRTSNIWKMFQRPQIQNSHCGFQALQNPVTSIFHTQVLDSSHDFMLSCTASRLCLEWCQNQNRQKNNDLFSNKSQFYITTDGYHVWWHREDLTNPHDVRDMLALLLTSWSQEPLGMSHINSFRFRRPWHHCPMSVRSFFLMYLRDDTSVFHQDLFSHLCVYGLLQSGCQPYSLVFLQSNMHEISLDISCKPVQMCQTSIMSYNNCGLTCHGWRCNMRIHFVPHQIQFVSRPEGVPPYTDDMTTCHIYFSFDLLMNYHYTSQHIHCHFLSVSFVTLTFLWVRLASLKRLHS